MKELLNKASLTSLILLYLFLCGAIYLISYYSTFDFDITNYIDLLDVPKSFIYPLVSGLGVAFISLIMQGVAKSSEKLDNDRRINSELIPILKDVPTKKLIIRILMDYHTWVILVLLLCLTFYKPRREFIHILAGAAIIVFAVTKFLRNGKMNTLIPNYNIRLTIAILIFFVPIYINLPLNPIMVLRIDPVIKAI